MDLIVDRHRSQPPTRHPQAARLADLRRTRLVFHGGDPLLVGAAGLTAIGTQLRRPARSDARRRWRRERCSPRIERIARAIAKVLG